MSLTSTPALT